MKNFNFINFVLIGFLTALSFLSVTAQDQAPAADDFKTSADQRQRPKLVEQLDLTREQIQAIRRINAERRPLLREAQSRLREANRSLDEAIYSNDANEADIQARLKEVQQAQAEVARIRLSNELAVRRVLNAGQITKFRELRQQFNQKKIDRQIEKRNRKMDLPNRPAGVPRRIFRNRQRPPRPNI